MIKARTRLVFGVTSFLTLALSACGGTEDGDPNSGAPDAGHQEPTGGTARFADWTREERMAAVGAAGGNSAALALAHLFVTDVDAQFGTCPERIIAGDQVTYASGAGCTTDGGVTYEGAVVTKNTPRLEDSESGYDPSLPMRAQFEDFVRVDATSALFVDGTFEQTPSETGYVSETNLTVEYEHLRTLMVGATDCVAGESHTTCTLREGAHGALSGRGTFLARGELKTSAGRFGGWLELQGQDLLRIEFTPDQLCSPITIDGVAAGELCREPSEESPPEGALEVTGSGLGCSNDGETEAFTITASVRGNPDRVYAQLANGDTLETHELVKAQVFDNLDESQWEIVAASGVDTSFVCSDFSVLGVRIVAEKGDASTCYLPPQGSGSPWSGGACE